MKYTGEGLVTNIALSFALCYTHLPLLRLSPGAVYFIQTGGSALSNTYSYKFLSYLSSYNFSGLRTGFSNLLPAFRNVTISVLSTPGYGVLPSEKISQQVIP